MSTRHEVADFTPEKRDRLRAAYDDATSRHLSTFQFEGNVYVTAFAKYVLEYLDNHFQGATNA